MNDHRTRAARAYLEARVQSASPAELIALLYEGLAKEVRLGVLALDRGDVVERGVAVGRAVGILAELRTNLDHESGGEVATNLERLYAYWTRRITEAHGRSQRAPLDEIVPQIESLRSAWNEGVVRGTAGVVSALPEREAVRASSSGAPASPSKAAVTALGARHLGATPPTPVVSRHVETAPPTPLGARQLGTIPPTPPVPGRAETATPVPLGARHLEAAPPTGLPLHRVEAGSPPVHASETEGVPLAAQRATASGASAAYAAALAAGPMKSR